MVVSVMFSHCGNTSSQDTPPYTSASKSKRTTKLVDGEKIFKKYCKLCHGQNGKLGLNGAKDLTKSTMPLEDRIVLITNGKVTMTPFKGVLNEKEINAVAKYTMKFSN